MADWSDLEWKYGIVDLEGNVLIDDHEPDAREIGEGKKLESIEVELTPGKYLSSEGRYLRAKLTNNELDTSSIKLEVLHDKFNDNDPLALEVYCNQISIGYIQKYTSTVDVDHFCFIDNVIRRKLYLEWKENEFSLFREQLDTQIKACHAKKSDSDDDRWTYRLWEWADINGIGSDDLPRDEASLLKKEGLHIGAEKIVSIPKEIGNLKNLRYLGLYNLKLESIPKEIGYLKKLKELVLSHNNLTTLPKEIGDLKKLKTLILSHNDLTTLPKEIGDLKKLKNLILNHNNLTTLPKEIGDLEKLDMLNLRGNKDLTSLPEEIGNLTQLRGLNLRDTGVDSLPESIENLTKLIRYTKHLDEITFLPSDKPKSLW